MVFVVGGERVVFDGLEVLSRSGFIDFGHFGMQGRLVLFKGKDIVPTLFHNDARILGLTVGCIHGHNAPA